MANTFIPVRINYSGNTPVGFAEYQTGEAMVLPGSFQLTGSSRRITADFSTGGAAAFQNSITNALTSVNVIPNGTATVSSWAIRNSSDASNYSNGQLYIDANFVSIRSGAVGTGNVLPIIFTFSGTNRFQVSPSGDVTIPTTGARLLANFSDSTAANRVGFMSSVTNGATQVSVIPNGTNTNSSVMAWSASDLTSASTYYARMLCNASGATLECSSATQPLMFTTNGAERARITNSGLFYLGSPGGDPIGSRINSVKMAGGAVDANIDVMCQSAARAMGICSGALSGGSATLVQFFYYPSGGSLAGIGAITTNGTTTAYNTSSDYRLKDKVKPADAATAWERLDRYLIRTFVYKSMPDTIVEFGGIAHELAEVNPGMVTGTKDGVEELGSMYAMRPVGDLFTAEGEPVAQGIEEPNDHGGWWIPTGLAEFLVSENQTPPIFELPGTRWEKTSERMVVQGVDWSKASPELILNQQTAKEKIIALEERAAAQDARIAGLEEQLRLLIERLQA